MTCERAIRIIQNYRRRYLFEPRGNWGDYEFNLRSYARWCADELINRICDNSWGDPIRIIRNFRNEMDDRICRSNRPITWTFASYVLNGSEDILDLLLSAEREEKEREETRSK